MTASAWTALAILTAYPTTLAALIIATQRAYRRAPKHPAPKETT